MATVASWEFGAARAARIVRLMTVAAFLGGVAIQDSLAELPGDIAVAAPRVNIGDTITVELRLAPGGPYGGGLSPAFISLARPGAATQDYLQSFDFGFNGLSGSHTIPFQAPFETGRLEVRLYAWEEADAPQRTVPVAIVFDPVPGAIGIKKRAFAPGEEIAITTALPAGRNYYGLIPPMSLPWIAVLPSGFTVPAIDWIERFEFSVELGAAGVRQLVLHAPNAPGSYVIALYHGATSQTHYTLDAVDIEVAATPEEAQRINDALGRIWEPWMGAFDPDDDPSIAAERDAAAAPREIPGQVETAVVNMKPNKMNVTVLGPDGRPVAEPDVAIYDLSDSVESGGKGRVILVSATDIATHNSYQTIIYVPDGKDVDLTVQVSPRSNGAAAYFKVKNAKITGDADGFAEGYAELKQAVEQAERLEAEGRNATQEWAKENDLPILTLKQVGKRLEAAEKVGVDRQDKKAVDLLRTYQAMLDGQEWWRKVGELGRKRLAELKSPEN